MCHREARRTGCRACADHDEYPKVSTPSFRAQSKQSRATKPISMASSRCSSRRRLETDRAMHKRIVPHAQIARRVTLSQLSTLASSGKSQRSSRPSRLHMRGVSRSSRTWERDAMDVGSPQCAPLACRRTRVSRTVKSCGPDTPMLVSSATRASALSRHGGKRARSPGRARSSRNTVAQGRPDVRLVPVVLPRASCCTRTMGADGTRPSLRPHVSRGTSLCNTRTRPAPRERELLSCESR